MTATAVEKWDGRRITLGANPSAEMEYLAFGCADEKAAESIVRSTSPTVYTDVPTGEPSMPRAQLSVTERLEATTWRVVVRYSEYNPRTIAGTTAENTVQFDTTGGTQKITQSISTIARYGTKASATLAGAIGWDGENVQGCDVVRPAYSWTETTWFAPASITDAYKRTLALLTGTVNAGAFRAFSAGEVLFIGATGQRNGTGATDLWQLTYKFSQSTNQTGLTIGGIAGVAKKGWEYLWIQYGKADDTSTKQMIKKPVAIYVEQVYSSADFTALGI